MAGNTNERATDFAFSNPVRKANPVNPERFSISVIIPTRNRPDDLENTVASLFRQTLLADQLIILDQSPEEDSRKRIENLFASASSRIKEAVRLSYLRDTTIASAAVARNRAMDVAEGTIWLFLDDDVELEADFVQATVETYRRHPDVAGVSGVVTNYLPPPLSFRLWNAVFALGVFHDERQGVYWRADGLGNSEPIPVRKFGGGLMSFRASAIQHLRFDPCLRGASEGEDVEFCSRLAPGSRLVINPRARLVHKLTPIARSQHHWIRREAKATTYLHWKCWREGLLNRLCYWWFLFDYALVATFIGSRRCSLESWKALLSGIREGKEEARVL
jgi:GT2 family glycosyltransferase